MGAVAVWLRAELGRRRGAWVGLTLLVGLSAGIVLGTLAAADRADGAYGRFLDVTNPADVIVQGSNELPFDDLAALPEVAETGFVAYALLFERGDEHRPEVSELSPLVSVDGVLFDELNTARLIEGRAPRAPLEMSITPLVAEDRGLAIGDEVTFDSFTPAQTEVVVSGEGVVGRPEGPVVTLQVVGIAVAPTEFLPSGNGNTIHLAPSFLDAYGSEVGTAGGMAFRLHRGADDVAAFKVGVERLLGGAQPGYITQTEDAAQVQRSIHLQVVALRAFAAVAALVALIVVGQGLARQAAVEDDDHRVLGALGVTRGQLTVAVAARAAAVAVVGAAIAAVLAVALSPVLLFGLARQAEPDRGVAVDGGTLALGVLVVIVVTVALAAASSAVQGRRLLRGSRVARSSRVASAATQLGAPPSATAGLRMALDTGGGRPPVPVRTSLVGAVASVAAVVVSLSFAASLDHLFATPPLYGWNWDALYGNPYTEDVASHATPILARSPEVGGYSTVSFAQVEVDGLRTQALAFDTLQGSVLPSVVAGRAPDRPDEIAMGAVSLDRIGAGIGDVVTLQAGDASTHVRVVGRVVLPGLGQYDVDGLGEGALLTQDGLERVADAPRNLFAVSFAAGVDASAVARTLSERLSIDLASLAVAPEEVANFGRVDSLPAVLAGLVATVGAATLAHVVMVGVRRRRRDLAVLKALGFVRRDLRATVGWQATTLAVIALVVGVPLGVALGRVTWRIFADGLGVVPEPIAPLLAIALLVPAALVVANAVAVIPGGLAARTPAGESLTSE